MAEIIKEYWGLVLFVLGLIYHALWSYFRIADHASRIEALESSQKKTNDVITEIRELNAEMNAKLDILLEGYKKRK